MKTENVLLIKYFLLPTNEISGLFLDEVSEFLNEPKRLFLGKITHGCCVYQHLYLCSHREIKKGNEFRWIIVNNTIHKLKGLDDIHGYINHNENIPFYFIEFTTDAKLISDGVPNLPKEVWVDSTDCHPPRKVKINFLEEFCKRNNKNNNKKVCETCGQGEFSLKQLKDAMLHSALEARGMNNSLSISPMINKYVQSLTKEQPKGEIIIECEMEEITEVGNHPIDPNMHEKVLRIKLINGQPVIHFKS